MRGKVLKSEGLLLLTAAIWGFAFVAQRAGMEHVGPLTFNAVRFAVGSLVLVPFLVLGRRRAEGSKIKAKTDRLRTVLFRSGIAGVVLFAGATLQQVGIVYTTAGRAGFITGLYLIIVPILGLLWRQRPGSKTWFGAGLAVFGLYLLSVTGSLTASRGDLLVLISAFFWACHVLLIGRFSPRTDNLTLACLQCATCSVLSLAGALAAEVLATESIMRALIPILYAGLLSTGVAYTLQIVAQKRVPSANAAIIMSLEAVFAVLGGWLLLREVLSSRALVGCGLMLAGMVMAQLDPKAVSGIPESARRADR